MSLIVEDGTGLSTAESYISVADADAYFAARNLTLWASADFSTAEKEACLRRATDYMGQVFRLRWAGQRVNATQALDWPRYNVPRQDYGVISAPSLYDSASVPVEVKHACAEMAWRAAFGELYSDQGTPATSKTVGPITVAYAAGARQSKRYVAVEALLAPLLTSSADSFARVVRA